MGIEVRSTSPCLLEGDVIELHERDNRCLVAIRTRSNTVVELQAAGPCDFHLGDRVVVEGELAVARIRLGPDPPPDPPHP